VTADFSVALVFGRGNVQIWKSALYYWSRDSATCIRKWNV